MPSQVALAEKERDETATSLFEEILEKKLEDMATLLYAANGKKSRVYDDIIDLVERSLFRIALRRCNHVKTAASAYLGISRNTFQKKMTEFGLDKKNGK